MSLTAALAILAGLVLVAVVAHGLWSAWRLGGRSASRASTTTAPKPAGAARQEPHLGQLGHPPGQGHLGAVGATDDWGVLGDLDDSNDSNGLGKLGKLGNWAAGGGAAAAAIASAPAVPSAGALARRWARIDALIDAIATVTPEAAVSAELALQALPPSRRAGAKPLLVEGLNAKNGEWEILQPGARYSQLQAAAQLTNRHGPLNEIEYSEFVQKVQAMADALGATADFPDMLDVVARARELDAFASQHDVQLTMVLRANSAAWSVGYLQQAAARHGFVPGAVPGRLVLPAAEEAAPPVLALIFDVQAALADDVSHVVLREAVLSLDVPQTPAEAEPFVTWQEAARKLCHDLDATAVDDQQRPLLLHGFTIIDQDLRRLYAELAGRDLAAGSAAARRLFA